MVMRTRSFRSSSNSMSSKSGHRTVLLHEAIEQLAIQKRDVVVDATLGGGGHARAIAKGLGKGGVFIGIDLDAKAIERTRVALKDFKLPKIHLVEANFRNLSLELERLGVATVDKALFDLGWSGYQLDGGRGFSFLKDEPLTMTYSSNPGPTMLTASTIVNEWAEESIADVIFGWGEEHYARRIAKRIVERRSTAPFQTALELADAIRGAVPPAYRYGRIHPATKTFQALRIAVNDELGALKDGLLAAWSSLRDEGRIAVVSFHSIEDRIVKRMFVGWEKENEGKRITHSPIRASKEEIAGNPRSRSAKMRVIEKIVPGE